VRDIDLTRFPPVVDQVGDQLDVVLDQLQTPGLAGLAKALHVRFGADEGMFAF